MTAVELLVTPKFRVINHPGTSCHPSAEGNLDRDGMGVAPPSVVKGNLPRNGNAPSSPPLEGWRLAAGVVRECRIRYLIPCHSRAQGPRKYECICGVVKAGIL